MFCCPPTTSRPPTSHPQGQRLIAGQSLLASGLRAPVTDHGPAPGWLTDAPWDPDLAAALAEHGVAVPEERGSALLLDDLAA
ncbi:MAG: DUF2399 domain-containing protein [Pseudonocardiaceae bacterium]